MINIIIGKESNLTNALKKQLLNTAIFSARDSRLIEKIKLLNKYKKINLIFNNNYLFIIFIYFKFKKYDFFG